MEIPIDAAVKQHLADLGHPTNQHDVVFENAQARERTQLLFNYANKVGGIVVGTGDLSELALGWCTFNGDHMSNYNVNASVPKTMIAYLVRWYARHRAPNNLAKVLESVLKTPISPELLPPGADGAISQATESIIGPYELHDFFLYHYLRNGFAPSKIYALARESFAGAYPTDTIKRWMKLFFEQVLQPAVQTHHAAAGSEGGHGQPVATRRLAHAGRSNGGRVDRRHRRPLTQRSSHARAGRRVDHSRHERFRRRRPTHVRRYCVVCGAHVSAFRHRRYAGHPSRRR